MVTVNVENWEPGWILKFPRTDFITKTGQGCSSSVLSSGDLHYYHYTVYIGEGRIVHFDTTDNVRELSISEHFTAAIPENADRENCPLPSDQIVQYARMCARQGILFHHSANNQNCKWFAERCRYGPHS